MDFIFLVNMEAESRLLSISLLENVIFPGLLPLPGVCILLTYSKGCKLESL
jgi:hypothetical protein